MTLDVSTRSVAQEHLKLVPCRLCGMTPVSSEFSATVLSPFPPDTLRLCSMHYPKPEFDCSLRPAIGMGAKETKEIGREAGVN